MSWKTRLASGAVTLKPSLTGLRGHPLRETFATLALKVILRNSAMQRGVMSVTRIRGLGEGGVYDLHYFASRDPERRETFKLFLKNLFRMTFDLGERKKGSDFSESRIL